MHIYDNPLNVMLKKWGVLQIFWFLFYVKLDWHKPVGIFIQDKLVPNLASVQKQLLLIINTWDKNKTLNSKT